MKKIINGKKYDTATAYECGTWSNAGSWRDFSHIEETPYRKRTGEFFLFGEGGPMTRYAEEVDQNSWSGGSRIMPMSYAEAQEWAEEHLEADEYERIFGEIHEDETKRVAAYSLTAGAVEKLKRYASQRGVTASEALERLIEQLDQ